MAEQENKRGYLYYKMFQNIVNGQGDYITKIIILLLGLYTPLKLLLSGIAKEIIFPGSINSCREGKKYTSRVR